MHTLTERTEVPLRAGRIARREEWGQIIAEFDARGRLLCLSLDGHSDPRELADLLERARPPAGCAMTA